MLGFQKYTKDQMHKLSTVYTFSYLTRQHEASASWLCELRGHKWDMVCGEERKERMTMKPLFVCVGKYPEFK